MTDRHPRLAGLYALRAQIDSLIIAEEVEVMRSQPEPAGGCPHCGSHEQPANISTLDGTMRRHCEQCGQSWVVA